MPHLLNLISRLNWKRYVLFKVKQLFNLSNFISFRWARFIPIAFWKLNSCMITTDCHHVVKSYFHSLPTTFFKLVWQNLSYLSLAEPNFELVLLPMCFTFCPGLIIRLTSVTTGSKFLSYLKDTFLNWICPLLGQSADGFKSARQQVQENIFTIEHEFNFTDKSINFNICLPNSAEMYLKCTEILYVFGRTSNGLQALFHLNIHLYLHVVLQVVLLSCPLLFELTWSTSPSLTLLALTTEPTRPSEVK